MSESRSTSRSNRGTGNSMDEPPMSRLFVICNKTHTQDELHESFSKYGNIEDVWMVKDKQSGEHKGIAYIKFVKSSEAAKAQEELNGKCIGHSDRPLKILVAANRNQGSTKHDNEQERCVRLFIVISKTTTEDEIRNEFEKFGKVEHISIVKDRNTGQSKGFGYVKYDRFYNAAIAFENCCPKFRAVFAEPKSTPRNYNDDGGNHITNRNDKSFHKNYKRDPHLGGNNYGNCSNSNFRTNNDTLTSFFQLQPSINSNKPTCLEVICGSTINQDQLWRLFDIIPGLDYCQLVRERGPRTNEATVVYNSPEAAFYAKDKLHGLEYPPGERLIIKIGGLDMGVDNTFLDKNFRKDTICSANLPPAAPLASPDTPVVRRCFIVLASGLPHMILKNVFCCFGGLIDVYLLPHKNCGYVKYASVESAQKAIETLNGSEICGIRIKVMKADEPEDRARKRKRLNST